MNSSEPICIFTIASNNYLHLASTLFDSLAKYCPQADLFLALCDEKIDKCVYPEVSILPLRELGIPDLGRLIYQYTILELNTAIKPYVFEQLFHTGFKKVIYFDPDI